jgi:hypothetical protein
LPNRPADGSARRTKNQKRSTARTQATLFTAAAFFTPSIAPYQDADQSFAGNARRTSRKAKIFATSVEQDSVMTAKLQMSK